MNNNELDKKDSKNAPKEAPTSTISTKKEEMGKDTLEPKSSIFQAQTKVKKPLSLGDCQTYLDQLDPKTKVKVKILDFDSFRQFLPLCSKYSTKFETFKYSTEFDVVSDLAPISVENQKTTFKESFSNWLKNQKIDPKITEILKKEIE
jgi:hypothetical protein